MGVPLFPPGEETEVEGNKKVKFFFFFFNHISPFKLILGCYCCSEREPKEEVQGEKKVYVWTFERIGLVLIKASKDTLRIIDYFLLTGERCGSSIVKKSDWVS